MSKMRVYEYARAQNMSSKEVLEILKRLKIDIRNHMSVLDEQKIEQVEAYMRQLKQAADPTQAAAEQKGTGQKKAKEKTENNQQSKKKNHHHKKKTSKSGQGKQKGAHHEAPEKRQNKQGPSKAHNKPLKKGKKKQKYGKQGPETHTVEKMTITGPTTVGELAQKMGKESSDVIKKLMLLGTMATINEELEMDAIELIADEYGIKVEKDIQIAEEDFEQEVEEDDPVTLQERPPVVTVMGHVDHGKTTLLDAIRQTDVTAGEAGGITQHIGAYQISYQDKKITFLDTPGHEAFTTMRARGAQVTDVAIIVVAADDGVMPQTREAINHAQAAEVPIIVAVNKMDKPEVNPDRVKQELTEMNLVPEEWGGETIFVHVSALRKDGLDELMEMVLLVSEVEELKANPDREARGTVIEAELDKGKGPVATVLVESGTLHVGDPLVIGNTYGRVRAMSNDVGKRIQSAAPSTPVEIIGLQDVPQAGDQFKVFADEKKARAIGEKRAVKQKETEQQVTSRVNLDQLFEQIQQGDLKELKLIIKADVQGSVEALRASLERIEVEDVNVKIIHSGVGAITDSDISLASASNAIVIGFNVRPRPQAMQTAEREHVDVRLHRIIYDVIEEIESAMKGMLDPVYEEKVIGSVEVRQIFKGSKVGTIAGSYVREGRITRDSSVRLIRDGVVIYEGEVDVLKRFKDDVREVQNGYECGITLENFNDIKEGDLIESYIMEEIQR